MQAQDKPTPTELPLPTVQAPKSMVLTQQATWTAATSQSALVSKTLAVPFPGQSELYGQAFGWTQYSAILGNSVNGALAIADVRDRAIVLVDGRTRHGDK